TLRVDGRLAAVHLGLRTERTLHWWIPAYNPDFAQYSAGAILLRRLAEESARRGILRLDLGKGRERYKSSFASGSVPVATGSADLVPLRGALRSGLRGLVRRVKASPAGAPARRLVRWARNRTVSRRMDAAG